MGQNLINQCDGVQTEVEPSGRKPVQHAYAQFGVFRTPKASSSCYSKLTTLTNPKKGCTFGA